MLSLFKPTQLIDANTAAYIHDCFDWLSQNFNEDYYLNTTQLIHPTREYFPDRANNELQMATALCKRIQRYSGLSHWPFSVVPPQNFQPEQPPLLAIQTNKRCTENEQPSVQASNPITGSFTLQPTLNISYSPAMMKKPMDLVGSMAKNIAQHYLFQSQLPLPAGSDSFDATAEILAVYMGFGLFIANSAYTFRGGCGSCYDPRANREAALPEDEAIYCLALFCENKGIETKAVLPSLKGYLRGSFKKARRQAARNNQQALTTTA